MRTRIAPTPSGFLHLGNCANFRLIADIAESEHGSLRLRIDDMDVTRSRPEYVEDIFRILDWLEISPDAGPRDVADFEANFAMHLRTEHYRAALDELRAGGAEVFVCRCSRTALVAGCCVAGCIDQDLELAVDASCVRMRLPEDSVVVSGEQVVLRAAHGDVVLWRRDGLPAYHLVTVVEDRDAGITDAIRGWDLLDSSALHMHLGAVLGSAPIAYRHHPLLVDEQGHKLSKSVLAANESSPLALTAANLEFIRDQARGLRSQLR